MGDVIKTVLLTGATGYLGGKLLEKLLLKNYSVCIIKRESSSLEKFEGLPGNFKFYNNDEESISKLFVENSIDFIIHMATAYGRKGESLQEIKAANLDFPLRILHYAMEHEVKFFLNTSTSLPKFTNQYALFKKQFSECLEFFTQQITSINVLLEHFYGPDDDNSKFVTSIIQKMKSNVKEIPLTVGTQIRDFIFVEDVLNAYLTIIDHADSFIGYNNVPLGSGEGVTIRSIVEMVKELSDSSTVLQFGAVAMRENELMKSDADISILKQLGWQPGYSLKEGLGITINSVSI